jgi:hypothetical protein
MSHMEKQLLQAILNWHSDRGYRAMGVDNLSTALPDTPTEQINSALALLVDQQVIEADRGMGGGFSTIQIKSAQWLRYGQAFLGFNPQKDMDAVYKAIERLGWANGEVIAQEVKLPFGRADMAVMALHDRGSIECYFEHPAPGGYTFSLAIWPE